MATSSTGFLVKHVGHEVKYFAYAVAEFRRKDAARHEVALQDSALVRGRVLIDFFAKSGGAKNISVKQFYEPPRTAHPSSPERTHQWYDFISERTSHIGMKREVEFDRWPDRRPGEDKGEDRLNRLAALVLELMKSRVDALRPDCRSALQLMIKHAEEYLSSPSDERFRAMDPVNLERALADLDRA